MKCPVDGSEMLDAGRLAASGEWSPGRIAEAEEGEHDLVSPPVHYVFLPAPPMASEGGHHEAVYVHAWVCPKCGFLQPYVRQPEKIVAGQKKPDDQ